MPPVSFDQLSPAEREELALCGITTAEQLERCSVEDLARDLKKLKSYFPDRVMVLTEARLHAICGLEETPQPAEVTFKPAAQFTHKKDLREEIMREKEEAEQERVRKAHHRHQSPAEKLERMHGLSSHFHAIRCSHPARVYFGAWSTLLLIVPLFALFAIPVMILTGELEGGKPIYFGAAFVALIMPWFLIARRAQCGVCHIPLFKFGNYPHNRAAHHLPLLGYTITTALHIIFLFWFRCPACGTPMKISGSSHRHHH